MGLIPTPWSPMCTPCYRKWPSYIWDLLRLRRYVCKWSGAHNQATSAMIHRQLINHNAASINWIVKVSKVLWTWPLITSALQIRVTIIIRFKERQCFLLPCGNVVYPSRTSGCPMKCSVKYLFWWKTLPARTIHRIDKKMIDIID